MKSNSIWSFCVDLSAPIHLPRFTPSCRLQWSVKGSFTKIETQLLTPQCDVSFRKRKQRLPLSRCPRKLIMFALVTLVFASLFLSWVHSYHIRLSGSNLWTLLAWWDGDRKSEMECMPYIFLACNKCWFLCRNSHGQFQRRRKVFNSTSNPVLKKSDLHTQQAFPLLKAAWDAGITTWDTANMYR